MNDLTWELSQDQIEFLMSKIQMTEFKYLTGEEMEFVSRICNSVRHKWDPVDVSRIMTMACNVFWTCMQVETTANKELSKKASRRISHIFKFNTKLDNKNTPR